MDYSTYDLDFTDEGRRRVYAFSYVLGYSRRQYLHFVESQDFATTVREHIRAFEHLGGVAATCLYDNMKVVVSGYDGDEPVYNPTVPGVRGPLRLPAGGLPTAAAPDEGESRAAIWICRNQLAWRPDLPLPGAPERDHGLVAGRGRRRARPSPDQGAADRSPRRGTASPDPAAGAAVRRRRGRLPHRRRRGVRGLPPEFLRDALAADRPASRGAGDRGRTGDPRPGVRRGGATSALPANRRGTAQPLQRPRATPRRATAGRSSWPSDSPSSARPGTRFLEGLLAGNRFGKNQAERVLVAGGGLPAQDVLAALERAVRYGAFSPGRRCNASSRRGAGPRRRWTRWPTTIGPIWTGSSTASRRRRDPPPTIKPCWARRPHDAGAITHPGKTTPKHPPRTGRPRRRRQRSLHDDVTAALRTLGVAVTPEALDAALSAAEKESLSHLEFLHRLLAGPAEATLPAGAGAAAPRREVPRADDPGGVRLGVQRQGSGSADHRATGDLRLRASA